MKLFVSKKKYDLLNKEYLILNDNYEELKFNYKEKCDKILDLEYKNEHSYFEKTDLENEVEILNQEVKLYQDTVKELAKLWNDANRKLWCNNESARQLRKLSEDILSLQKLDKNYIASYIRNISAYVGGGVGVEVKPKEEKENE